MECVKFSVTSSRGEMVGIAAVAEELWRRFVNFSVGIPGCDPNLARERVPEAEELSRIVDVRSCVMPDRESDRGFARDLWTRGQTRGSQLLREESLCHACMRERAMCESLLRLTRDLRLCGEAADRCNGAHKCAAFV